jgi:hypothetical protein
VVGHDVWKGLHYVFLSNFRILDGNFVGISNHKGWCLMGSFINHEILGRYKVVRKGNGVLANEFGLKEDISCDPNGPCGPPILLSPKTLGPLGTELPLGA